MKKIRKLVSVLLSAAVLLTGAGISRIQVRAEENGQQSEKQMTPSQQYAAAMGQGWNLGNSFDGVDTDLSVADKGETAWGNPVVTRELIHAVKEKGFQSIRIPMTIYHRFTKEDGKYTIDPDWLARYKEVVDWAVEEGLYVMVNIHHDSWIWLSKWEGSKEAEEYARFTQFWEQLAAYFSDEPEQVCFETINEPRFESEEKASSQERLDVLNQTAYDIIRKSGGKNDKRMIIMPTVNTETSEERVQALYTFIKGLNDPNIIATVHYYSEWVYSANLGITEFDEMLGDDGNTPRNAADKLFETLSSTFTDRGIGVIVGEYGLLGYDSGEDCLQQGEELKYYEYMGAKAAENESVCLMFWDNGSGINRADASYAWKKPLAGTMLETSIKQRSSYVSILDTLYFDKKTEKDVEIPLTLNGNTLTGIKAGQTELTEGTDYVYQAGAQGVTLKSSYINKAFDTLLADAYGTFADLEFTFSAGAPWHEYLVKYSPAVFGSATGTVSEGIRIPVSYHGSRVRRATAYGVSGKVGEHSGWWNYLQYKQMYEADYEKQELTVSKNFFADESVKDGLIRFEITFYDGNTADLWLKVADGKVTAKESLKKAPSAAAVKVKAGKKKTLRLKNVADGAVITYQSANKKTASVTDKGIVKGKKAGKTKVKVSVTQYGKTETFTVAVSVTRK